MLQQCHTGNQGGRRLHAPHTPDNNLPVCHQKASALIAQWKGCHSISQQTPEQPATTRAPRDSAHPQKDPQTTSSNHRPNPRPGIAPTAVNSDDPRTRGPSPLRPAEPLLSTPGRLQPKTNPSQLRRSAPMKSPDREPKEHHQRVSTASRLECAHRRKHRRRTPRQNTR